MSFNIDLSEADQPLDAYKNIEEVFTRHLKPGCRPPEGPLCSPADGFLSYSLPLSEQGQAIQAKGLDYSPTELLGQVPAGELGWFTTVYLAPHNYHRVHSPVAGRLLSMRYIPGDLWPVNDTFVKQVPRLFCSNERLVFELEAEQGGRVYAVMVGALNVGRMSSKHWPELTTNSFERQRQKPRVREKLFPQAVTIGLAEELGVFMLGSTVVLLFEKELLQRYPLKESIHKTPIRMGQSLGEKASLPKAAKGNELDETIKSSEKPNEADLVPGQSDLK